MICYGPFAIIIFNDNNMSISKNVGGLSNFLSSIRVSDSYDLMKKSYKDIMSLTNIGTKIYNTSSKAKEELKKMINTNIFTNLFISFIV